MSPWRAEIRVLPDTNCLAQAAAEQFIQAANQALASRAYFSAALAGGATPLALYTLLSHPAYSSRLAWEKIHLFWGDERCVAPEQRDSNYGLVRRALLEHVPIPAANIHRMAGEREPAQAALIYEQALRQFFGDSPAHTFDLVLLGMGDDGHTASLFPGSPALEETRRRVVPVQHDQPPAPLVNRLTLTLPVINAARQVVFLIAGASKAFRLAQVLAPVQPGQTLLPAQRVQPSKGGLCWLVEAAAAQQLTPDMPG